MTTQVSSLPELNLGENVSSAIVGVLPAAKRGRLFFKDASINWPAAEASWGVAWPLHIYVSVVIYALLATSALVHIIRVARAPHIPSKAYYIALNVVILVATTSRTVHLSLDPYGWKRLLNRWQTRLAIAPLFPGITTGFILIFATLMRLTKMRLVSHRIFSPRAIVLMTAFNYLVGMSTEMIGAFFIDVIVLLFVCEVYFVCWGLVASSAYFYVFGRLYVRVVINRRKLNELTTTKTDTSTPMSQISSEGTQEAKVKQRGSEKGKGKGTELDTKMPVAAKLTLVCGVSFMAIAVLHIWRISEAISAYNRGAQWAEPWQWWSYKTCLRISEFVMCGTILYVGALPLYGRKK